MIPEVMTSVFPTGSLLEWSTLPMFGRIISLLLLIACFLVDQRFCLNALLI